MKISIPSILMVIAVLGLTACSPGGVPREDYDRVTSELNSARSELSSAQAKLAEVETLKAENDALKSQIDSIQKELDAAQSQYDKLNAASADLQNQYDAARNEIKKLQNDYTELEQDYETLLEQSAPATEEPAVITEADIEQAIFDLVNQDRVANSLSELTWGDNLYKWAQANSRDMANTGKELYPDYGWQAIFWATGYSITDRIANAALTVWQNSEKYDLNFLNPSSVYGTVAVVQSGEIYYITYIADVFR